MASSGPQKNGSYRVSTAADQARRASKRYSQIDMSSMPSIPQGEPAASSHMRRASKRMSTASTFGGVKSDYGVPLVLDNNLAEKRKSRRISVLSDISAADTSKRESYRMSNSHNKRMSMNRRMSAFSDVSEEKVGWESRRESRRMSTLSGIDADKRRSNRMSMFETPGESTFGDRASFMRTSRADWAQPVELAEVKHWKDDPENSANWKQQKKVVNTIIVSTIAFACTFSSSAYAPARQSVQDRLHTSEIMAMLPYSLYILGLAFGPMIGGPFASLFGQKATVLTCMPVYALLTLGAGFDNSIVGLIVLHFVAGLFAGPGLFVGAAVIADIWFNARQGLFVSLYAMVLLIGLPAGPLAGSYVIEHISWRWSEWLPLIAILIALFSAFALDETHKATILRRRERDAWDQEQAGREIPQRFDNWPLERRTAIGSTFKNTSTSALAMLAAPAHGLFSLYIAFSFAVMYSFFVEVPVLFPAAYGLDIAQQGYTFAGMCVGIVIAVGLVFLVNKKLYEPRVASWKAEKASSTEGLIVEEKVEEKKAAAVEVQEVPKATKAGYRTSFTRRLEDFPAPQSGGRSMSFQSRTSSVGYLQSPTTPPVSAQIINVSSDVTRYINAQPGNEAKQIAAETISGMLSKTEKYSEICSELEGQGLKLDSGDLAKVIVDALAKKVDDVSPEPPIARSQSLHREAAIAALSNPNPLPPAASIAGPSKLTPTASEDSEPSAPLKNSLPPAEWRLLPALPASILMPVSLFIFAWTTRANIPWIVPVIGMSLFAASCMLLYIAASAYATELYEFEMAERARAGTTFLTFVLSAIFPLFIIQMYSALGVSLATSVLGAVAIFLGFIPWLFVVFGEGWRKAAMANGGSKDDEDRRMGVVMGSWYRWSGRAKDRFSGKPREIRASTNKETGLASVWE